MALPRCGFAVTSSRTSGNRSRIVIIFLKRGMIRLSDESVGGIAI